MTTNYAKQIAAEFSIAQRGVEAVLHLLQEGNTIPFIARYRKEATGSLDEVQVRLIKERADYLLALDERKQAIITSIEAQGKLTDSLRNQILACESKTELEDLYLPYKPKRRTKATIAKEKGLEPLALILLEQPFTTTPEEAAASFVDSEKQVPDIASALEGARHIVAEWISERADIRSSIRDIFQNEAKIISTVRENFRDKPSKFEQYYAFEEGVRTIPSHRYLALRRGETEDVLSLSLKIDGESLVEEISSQLPIKKESPFSSQLALAVADSYKRLIAPSVESDLHIDLKMRSDREAVAIFAENLRHLLLAAPLGGKNVIGIDPGLRTGCKCAAVSETAKFLDAVTINLVKGERELQQAEMVFQAFVKKYNPIAIAIGNGTGGRETEAFVKEVLKKGGMTSIIVVQVSESGASVYSASDVAREEFPDIDLTIRGAISIARRLQDPLAELVKVEPKALGVGQYQHDVYQPLLDQKLHDVVESCVNGVGVDLNTASSSLLSYVVGIGSSLSKKIVAHREEKGPFRSRKQLLDVSGLGPRAFEQAAGFLRIREGDHPLDASAVHPERYGLVEKMAKDQEVSLSELVGNHTLASSIVWERYVGADVGKETLCDILNELKKPGRDPRQTFERPAFREDVNTIEDLKKGMVLEGIVTNVTAFGAFVDIGVHQDGLVHISQLSQEYVKNPNEVVKTGDRIKVEVLEINCGLKRISLTTRIGSSKTFQPATGNRKEVKPRVEPRGKFSNNPFQGL